jgi:IS30 family transposase
MRRNDHSIRDSAATLGRGIDTINDELNRNNVAGEYNPKKAHHKAAVRRKESKFQGKKIVDNKALCAFVECELLKLQSPAAVSGRLATGLDDLPYVSRDAIEEYIRSVHGRRLEYQLKVLKQRNRRSRKKRPLAE